MEHIIFSANAVIPLFLLIATGYLVRRLKWINEKETATFNNLIFMVFLPALLFDNVRKSSLAALANGGIFVYVTVGILLVFALTTLVIMAIEPANPRRGSMIQGIARSNYSLFGIPMLLMLMPDADIGVASLLVAIIIPIYNLLSVVILTYFGSASANWKDIVIGVIKNPLIIATGAGLVFLLQGWSLPYVVNTALANLGGIATPLALFLLGASFNVGELRPIVKQTAIIVVGRLLVVPALMLIPAIWLGYRDVELACIMVTASSPTAVASYTMASKMGCDGPLAAAGVLFTATCSMFSLFLIILTLRTFGFL